VTLNEHIPALQALESVRVVAAADPVPALRNQALSLLGLPEEAGFETHAEMFAACELAYIVLAVPPSLRGPILADCARKGVHVVAEKPLATRPSEAQQMRTLMADAGLRFGLVHNYLYFPEYRLLRQLVSKGEVGQVRHISLNFLGVPDNPGVRDYQPQWRHDPAQAGGGVLMDMIHSIYLAEFLVGDQIRAVSAVVDNLGYPGGAVEDLALLQLHFSEAYATIQMGWGVGPGGVEVSGSQGRALIFYQDYGTGPFSALSSFTLVNGAGRREFTLDRRRSSHESFVAIHQDFIAAIQEGRQPVAPGSDGQRALEAALAAYASGLSGRVVELPLGPDHPVFRRGAAGLEELPAWSGSPVNRRGLFGLTAGKVDK
jgi:predicted dehydrogenase